MIKTTRVAIRNNDNELVNQWAREASASEKKAVFSADILARLIKNHVRQHGTKPPTDGTEEISESNL